MLKNLQGLPVFWSSNLHPFFPIMTSVIDSECYSSEQPHSHPPLCPELFAKVSVSAVLSPPFSSTQEGVSGHVSEHDILSALQYISKVNYSQTQCFTATNNILAACLKMIHGTDQNTTART